MPRVLQINDFPPGRGGGAEVVVARTADLLRGAGCAVDLFTGDDLNNRRLTPRRYLDNRIARRCLAARLASFRPDIVHLHNYYHRLSPGILAELGAYKQAHAVRVVMTAHDYHLVCPEAGGTWFRGRSATRQPADPTRLGSWSYLLSRSWDRRGKLHSALKLAQHAWNYRLRGRRRLIDRVLAPSRFLQTFFAAAGQEAQFLPYPVPELRRRPARRPRQLHLAFAGRLEPEKGLHEFLSMLPAGLDATLTVAGDGSDLVRCRKTCRRRGLEGAVTFLGRLPHPEVADVLARAHVLVLPSLFLENSPMCLFEALAVGANLLVSDRGGSRETVEASGVGHVFAANDAGSLGLQLERIVRAHRQGTLNQFDVRHFLQERGETAYLRRLLAIYEAPGIPEGRAA